MVARDFDQYLFFYEFLNAFTGIIGKKIDRERVNFKQNCGSVNCCFGTVLV